MKIAITSMGNEITSNVDPRFGRARQFIVMDTESNNTVVHNNSQNLNAAQGAGIQAGETIARLGATVLITGNVGPKAFRVLDAAKIKVYLCGQMPVVDAVNKFKAGELTEITAANVEGHW